MFRKPFFPMTALGTTLLLLAGCVGGHTTPSRFYTLTPPASGNDAASLSSNKLLLLGPIVIPDYLDRPQIVTRSGSNELVITEFHRWGGSLSNDVTRTLVADLTRQMGTDGFTVLPWPTPTLTTFTTSYRVPVTITRFEGEPGKEIVLQASWQLLMKQGTTEKPLLFKEITITEQVTGDSHQELVAAMGRALQRLGADVSHCIALQCTVKSP
jgi:uncharacterized protein